MPQASIVIPCYNAEAHLRETLDSAISQTVKDIEIICVDNGSTDGTAEILSKVANQDERVKVIEELDPGEGPARDAGRKAATSKWVYFLDSDDLMAPKLLEYAIARGEAADSDLVIFRTEYLDDKTGEIRACPECFDAGWIQNWECEGVFSGKENPDRLFNSFQNWVHNKLYRNGFLRSHGIKFQHIHRMADILFTCRALAESNRIALLDETLHTYRTNNQSSALFSGDSYPLDFYEAFLELRQQLELTGQWDSMRISFVNWAEEAVAMNLWRCRSMEGFRTIATAMKAGGLESLGILDLEQGQIYAPVRHECCLAIAEDDIDELAFLYFLLERRHMMDLETELSRQRLRQEAACAELRSSTSYKLGNLIISPFVAARDLIRRRN